MFNYETIKETEKAILAKIPYWEATSEVHKKHKQFFFECWLPKSSIDNGTAYNIAFQKIEEKRKSNAYRKVLYATPAKYRTLGEFAPEKRKVTSIVIDLTALDNKRRELMAQHGVKDFDKGFFISPIVGDDVIEVASILRNPSKHFDNQLIPKKEEIKYI